MALHVELHEALELDAMVVAMFRNTRRGAFLPSGLFGTDFQVAGVPRVPRTLSGKKQGLPTKKLLLGQPIEKVINKEAMANPGCLDWYVAFAQERPPIPLA